MTILQNYALVWLGSSPQKKDVALLSLLVSYVRKDNPPIITIHGDADDVVPYTHAVRLQQALDRAGVPNQLLTIKGAGHGQFSEEQNHKAYDASFGVPGKIQSWTCEAVAT